MVLATVGTCQYQDIIIIDIFFLISQFQEFLIYLIQFLLLQINPQNSKAILQCSTSATSSQYNRIIIDTHIMRIDNLISLNILQYAILMNTWRVRKSITTNNSLVRLYRHIHQTGNHAAGRINLLRVDICLDIYFMMALDDHCYFFKCCISGTFTDTVDSHFHLTGAIQNTGDRIGCCHSQVVVAMSWKNGSVNTVYMVNQIFDFSTIFRW